MGKVGSILFAAGVAAALAAVVTAASRPQGKAVERWRFAVSGDSRNCGDIVMPAIAAGVRESGAAFYWHLGDFRKIYDFDEDMVRGRQRAQRPLTIRDYESLAWDDFIQEQLEPFGSLPVMLGIGNHETIPPQSREQFLIQFADWLNAPLLQEQRLRDDPRDHRLHAYYHWVRGGVDFINLDNATADQFDSAQLAWFMRLVQADSQNPAITTLVVGAHKALPDSLSAGHSMNETPAGEQGGRAAYQALLRARDERGKRIYLLASHSHFFMDGAFETPVLRARHAVLPGWIVGTAGAVRYPLPHDAASAHAAKTNVYGWLLGTVLPDGAITFEFRETAPRDVPAPVVDRYGADFVTWCFDENSEARMLKNGS